MIRIELSKCTGCRSCETACAFFHTGKVSNRLARIKVMHLYETGIDGPSVCTQCAERYCMDCPENAMTIGQLGEVIVAPTICTLCGSCVRKCPIGAIEEHEELIYVCDLCGGRPKCVDACTEGAIIFEPDVSSEISLAYMKDKVANLNISERRYHYIENLGKDVRKSWRRSP
ncbi:MAG: 4Fe-4S dicluster domain-containing protein [Candidatus Thorarchaeota archaeon]